MFYKMKKTLLAGIAALFLATGAAHATEDFCAVVLEAPANIKRDKEYKPDAWLVIRDGPGTQFMRMGKLGTGDFLWADTASCTTLDGKTVCDGKREWTRIVGIPKFDGPVDPNKRSYSGGWVRRKYIREFLWEEQQAEHGGWPPPKIPTYDNPNPK